MITTVLCFLCRLLPYWTENDRGFLLRAAGFEALWLHATFNDQVIVLD